MNKKRKGRQPFHVKTFGNYCIKDTGLNYRFATEKIKKAELQAKQKSESVSKELFTCKESKNREPLTQQKP